MKKFKFLIKERLLPVYFIKLSDLLYRKEIVKLVKEKFGDNPEILYFSLTETTLNEIFSHFRAQNIFDPKKIIVCFDGDFLSEKDKKYLIENVNKIKKVKKSILIIFFDSKRINHKNFIEISIPSEDELKKFIILYFKRNGIKVDKKFAQFIIENTGMDYNKISIELRKILSYGEGKDILKIEDIKDLINFSGEQNLFKLFDYFFEKDFEKTLKTFYNLKKLNTNINLLISILQKNIIQIVKIKSLLKEKKVGEKDISKIMSLNPYVVRKLAGLSKKVRYSELKEMYFDLFEIEKNLKSININPAVLFENFIIKYLKGNG